MEEKKIHQEAKEETRPLTDQETEAAAGGMNKAPRWSKELLDPERTLKDPEYDPTLVNAPN